jgi:hypothetical protein
MSLSTSVVKAVAATATAAPRHRNRSRLERARLAVFSVVTEEWFDNAMAVVILLNMVVMMCEHYRQGDDADAALRSLDLLFFAVYLAEALGKIFALGWGQYASSPWHRVDLAVILSSIGAYALRGSMSALTSLRVLRVFKLLRNAKSLNYLLVSLLYAIPTLTNVGSLLLILFFIYAVAGVALFGQLVRGDFINRHANFENFGMAFLTLFRMATGESWNGLMHDASVRPPDCVEPQCGSKLQAYAFFLTFEVLVFFVLINLFVAVILESFGDLTSESEGVEVRPEHFERFAALWSQYDPEKTFYMDSCHLEPLLRKLGAPLGFPTGLPKPQAISRIIGLDLPLYDGCVFYRDLIVSISSRSLGIAPSDAMGVSTEATRSLDRTWDTRIARADTSKRSLYTLAHLLAVRRIQCAWRAKTIAFSDFVLAVWIGLDGLGWAWDFGCCIRLFFFLFVCLFLLTALYLLSPPTLFTPF